MPPYFIRIKVGIPFEKESFVLFFPKPGLNSNEKHMPMNTPELLDSTYFFTSEMAFFEKLNLDFKIFS